MKAPCRPCIAVPRRSSSSSSPVGSAVPSFAGVSFWSQQPHHRTMDDAPTQHPAARFNAPTQHRRSSDAPSQLHSSTDDSRRCSIATSSQHGAVLRRSYTAPVVGASRDAALQLRRPHRWCSEATMHPPWRCRRRLRAPEPHESSNGAAPKPM